MFQSYKNVITTAVENATMKIAMPALRFVILFTDYSCLDRLLLFSLRLFFL